MIEHFSTEAAPPPAGHYSQVVTAGGFVFASGQVPRLPDGTYEPASVADETRLVLQNLEALATAAGATLADLVKVTAYLTDTADFAEFNEAYASIVPTPPPARTTVAAGLRHVKVELDAIFYVE